LLAGAAVIRCPGKRIIATHTRRGVCVLDGAHRIFRAGDARNDDTVCAMSNTDWKIEGFKSGTRTNGALRAPSQARIELPSDSKIKDAMLKIEYLEV